MRKLKQFIAENIINTEIFEMAISLNQYKENIENKIYIILVHILLIMKANEENSTEFVDHWKKEIRTFINNLCDQKIKTKDTYQSRYKHVYSVIIDKLDFDDNDKILYKCYNKLYQEGYDLDDKNTYELFINLFHNFQDIYLDELIDIIALQDFHKIKMFVDKL